ncbi:MAG: hypothetical protein NXI01_00860 [Gammaproteobacteria bacterium]|nr:hypothetical protein [Gammaproteobacteria bacterium]
MDYAKGHIKKRAVDVSFEQEPNAEQLFCDYFDMLKPIHVHVK